MAREPFRHLAFFVAGIVLAGCSGSDATDGRRSATTRDTVTIDGSIFTDFHGGLACDEYSNDGELLPTTLSGVVLTFSGAEGEILGETSTGALQRSSLDDGCRFQAEYRLSLPTRPGYRVDFEPPPAEESGFFGAEELATREISIDELEESEFRWDFEAQPTFVVSDPPCAFDETGCLAADLVVTTGEKKGLVLVATAGIEANGWTQEATATEGDLSTIRQRLGDPADYPTVAPQFQISVAAGIGPVDVLIQHVGVPRPVGPEVVESFELSAAGTVDITLEAGVYLLSITAVDAAAGQHHFGIRVP